MFKSQSKYNLFSYSIQFEDIINPFIDLISDFLSLDDDNNWGIITALDFNKINKTLAEEIEILKKKNKKFNDNFRLCNRKGHSKAEELNKDKNDIEEKLQQLKFQAYETICNYLFDEVFSSENLSIFGNSKIVLIDKINRRIVSNNADIQDSLLVILSNSKLVSKLIANTNKKRGKVFNKLINFDNKNLYKSYVNTEQLSILTCPAINLSYIKDSITKTPIENNDVWINEKFFNKYKLPELYNSSKDIFTLHNSCKQIGISVGNVCFFYESDPTELIKDEFLLAFYWSLLKNNIYRLPENTDNYKSDLVIDFNTKVKEEGFAHLLTYLKHNLYIEDKDVPDQYKKYFENNIKIEALKHLMGYELFLPDTDNPDTSLIGVYHTDKKPSENHYNLVHWITNHSSAGKIYEFSKEKPHAKNKKKIQVLKPEISFYFRHKYFEDFFDNILTDLGLIYLSNYKVKFKSKDKEAEFDYLIKTPCKIYLIELKTKLSYDYISGYEKKCSELIRDIPFISDNFEFVIIGALSHPNCEAYKSFIKEGEINHPGYNINREGVSTIPYRFSFPIEATNNKLMCIAEPSYERLKRIINEICI